MEEKSSVVCYKLGHCIAYVKSSGYVTSLNIGKTSYRGGMVFNTKAHTGVDALAYPYTATQHWLDPLGTSVLAILHTQFNNYS
jgi:hypothetical protein